MLYPQKVIENIILRALWYSGLRTYPKISYLWELVSLSIKGVSEDIVKINEVSIKVFCINNEDVRCLMEDGHDLFYCPRKFSPG